MLSLISLCFLINIQLLVTAFEGHEYDELNLQKWNSFKMQFNKVYESSEVDLLRMKIYLDNAAMIAEHNERFKKGEFSFELGMNQFGDLTLDEFVNLYTPHTIDAIPNNNTRVITSLPYTSPIPNSKNWVAEGAVTSVKAQGTCGCCWAFATAGALESHIFIRNEGKKPAESLSAQNLLDCVRTMYGYYDSCQGGTIDHAMHYVGIYGIATDQSYPYIGEEGACRFNSPRISSKIKLFVKLQMGNEVLLKEAVGLIGPVICAMDATDAYFRFYKTGLYYSETCSKYHLNHALVIVGYGTDENGYNYWLVKNSWGDFWGENGYVRILRNYNVCGIEIDNTYPIF